MQSQLGGLGARGCNIPAVLTIASACPTAGSSDSSKPCRGGVCTAETAWPWPDTSVPECNGRSRLASRDGDSPGGGLVLVDVRLAAACDQVGLVSTLGTVQLIQRALQLGVAPAPAPEPHAGCSFCVQLAGGAVVSAYMCWNRYCQTGLGSS